ncbi:MAG TPA: DNA-binding protein Alba [Methanothermococcus okinawensis]|uniref:DNA/RNA-binding protein Alba n=1 Tax=Methanofervidicoccus abyssi TaxID=2082189 RepID=A0A401HQV3_9EURY|nr:DNA-binding protein Alba [Methanofervidicoccus abyssi]GBF36654.1 archaea-specific DNA-binding protein [Methanofervidicoccus abyssi]HIP16311.1 DNA-binding protein Alba [Methanothermococcus okinawensis]
MMGTVFVGKKSIMNYVLAVITQFNVENVDKVVIKARGKAISKAVDVEEMVRNRFLPNVKVEEVRLGTDKVKNEDGRTVNVSTIEIVLSKE